MGKVSLVNLQEDLVIIWKCVGVEVKRNKNLGVVLFWGEVRLMAGLVESGV